MKKNESQNQNTFLGLPMQWDAKNALKGLWDKNDDRILLPKYFGIGWTLSFHPLLKATGFLRDDPRVRDLNKLPQDLPVPQDDGACDHLTQMELPEIQLRSTKDRYVNLSAQSQNPTILFFYPRAGEPEKPAPEDWDLIPGARGCAPQSCSFRDL